MSRCHSLDPFQVSLQLISAFFSFFELRGEGRHFVVQTRRFTDVTVPHP